MQRLEILITLVLQEEISLKRIMSCRLYSNKHFWTASIIQILTYAASHGSQRLRRVVRGSQRWTGWTKVRSALRRCEGSEVRTGQLYWRTVIWETMRSVRLKTNRERGWRGRPRPNKAVAFASRFLPWMVKIYHEVATLLKYLVQLFISLLCSI